MTIKLYTVDNDGKMIPFKTDVFGTLDASSVIDNEEDKGVKIRSQEPWKGLQDISIECEATIPDALASELLKYHAIFDAIRAAMFKLRKSCRNCRWLKLERDGKNHIRKKFTHYYCKCTRKEDTHLLWYNALTCEHFRRKCKSKP